MAIYKDKNQAAGLGAFSESKFGDDGSDQIRNCDIGPEPMGQTLNLSEKWLEANSDFARKIIPTPGVKQNSGRLDKVEVVEARSGDGDLPKGQRGKPFKWS
jgi:hypothetical protein